MPRQRSPNIDKKRSAPRQTQLSLATSVPGRSATSPPPPSSYPTTVDAYTQTLPTYSQTILQPPTLAADPSGLPLSSYSPGPPSATSRRQSASSMRNASMTFENVTPSSTPTGRISKAKKGKRVHGCGYPGCGKVFTRAEHRRRHELNHNPESVFRCHQPGCGKPFHRMDLLQRHQERHQEDASDIPEQSRPYHSNIYSSPPTTIPSLNYPNTSPDNNTRTSSGPISITSLVNPQQQNQFSSGESLAGFPVYMNYGQPIDFYGSEGSHSPASDHLQYHRQSISSQSSVAGFDYSSLSPVMTTSMPGYGMTAAVPPPIVLPSTFEEGQTSYVPSTTVNSMPLHLRPELDGVEFATIQRELSLVPELVFGSARPELPRYIRSDCLEHYWKYFHPSFPIVYKPNFVTNTPPPLLLSAVLAIGSFYDSRPDAKRYSLALQEIATRLLQQRENLTSKSRIADLQTVLLLEVLSKYCARHTSPSTSARFRQLYASLQQSRQILVQSPLAVFKTLKADRTEEGLKRAHKFWLEHEARRRIFHACAVLDSQQIFLFDQRPTVVSHSNAPKTSGKSKDSIDLPCNEDLWEASPLREWAITASESQPCNIDNVRSEYHRKSVGDYSFFQHQIINMNTGMKQRCIDEALTPSKQNGGPSKTLFNHHVYQMVQFTPVRQLLIVAGESWFLGQKVEKEAEYKQAKQIVRDWATTTAQVRPEAPVPNALRAYWHALKALRMLTNLSDPSKPFFTTYMLHEDWAVYLSALVCWTHWYSRTTSRVSLRTTVTPQSTPMSTSRKRKVDEEEVSTKRRKTTAQTSQHTGPGRFTTTKIPLVPAPLPLSTHGSIAHFADHDFAASRAGSYYDAPADTYTVPTDISNGENHSVYTSSTTPTALTRTASNTPQSRSSRATTVVPSVTSAPFIDENLVDFKAYLALTNVQDAMALSHLDGSTLDRIKGVLNTIRTHKIGDKRVIGGLMNDAERVLSRLVENRAIDMF